MWVWITAVFVCILIVSSHIKLRFRLIREGQDDQISLDIHCLLGLVRKRLAIPILQFHNLVDGVELKTEYMDTKEKQLISTNEEKITTQTIQDSFNNLLILFKNCFQFNQWLIQTIKRVKCTRFCWKTRVGLGDAPETAVAAGMIWGFKSTLLGLLARFIELNIRPDVKVIPYYNETKFSTQMNVWVKIRLFYLTIAACSLLYRIIKTKGGLKAWRRVLFKA